MIYYYSSSVRIAFQDKKFQMEIFKHQNPVLTEYRNFCIQLYIFITYVDIENIEIN